MQEVVSLESNSTSPKKIAVLLTSTAIFSTIAGIVSGYTLVFSVTLIVVLLMLFFLNFSNYAIIFLAVYFPFEEMILKFLPLPDIAFSALRYAGEILIYALFFAVIGKKIWQRSLKTTPLDIPLFIFVSLSIISAFVNNTSLIETGLFLRGILRYVFLYYAVVNLDLSNKFIHNLTSGLIFIGFVQVVLGFAQLLFGGFLNTLLIPQASSISVGGFSKQGVLLSGLREPGSIWGTTGDTISLALFLLMTFTLSISRAIFSTGYRKFVYLALGTVFFVGIIYTYSRGAMLATFFSIVSVIIFKKSWTLIIIVALLIVLLSLIPSIENTISGYKQDSAYEEIEQTPFDHLTYMLTPKFNKGARVGRLQILLEVPGVTLSKSPFFGFGPRRTTELKYYLIGDVYWVYLFYKLGILGFAAYLMILLQLFQVAHKAYTRHPDQSVRILGLSFLALLAGIGIYNFSGPTPEIRTISLYFWLFAGLLVSFQQRASTNKTQGDEKLDSQKDDGRRGRQIQVSRSY